MPSGRRFSRPTFRKAKKALADQQKTSRKAERPHGGRQRRANRRNNDRRKNNTSFKRVNLDASARSSQAARQRRPNHSWKASPPRRPKAAARSKAGKDERETLKIIPLGGLDGIGKNMTVFECNGDMILDDAGLMFPDDDHPGIDLILPDYVCA